MKLFNLLISIFLISLCLNFQACTDNNGGPSTLSEKERLIKRAKSFELDTPYNFPPGNGLEHHTAGFAKILCSAVFVTGLDFDFAAEHVGYFSSPYEERAKIKDRRVDMENKAVHVTLPSGVVRTAVYTGDQGCVCLAKGEDALHYEPKEIESSLGDAATTPWPMGDDISSIPWPAELDKEKITAAVDAAFKQPEGLTAAYVVSWKGNIIGERYGEGIDMHTSLESWSMGKSLTATLMGTLIQKGEYDLYQAAPIPEWQEEGDPRKEIRIADILRMSSGIRFRAPLDPDYDLVEGYPDHLYVYTGGVNSFHYAASLPQQWPPNTIGRYRNCDPVLTNYLIRLGVEARGEDYLSYPTRALFDKIGMRNMVLETDPYGNFLLQGYELGSGRDWTRLGNLYLNDGVWNGERILPEGFVEFASTLAPAWEADERPIYGGFFWINGDESYPIPKEAYFMAGAGNQKTIIIPSHDLVVVRLGHYSGSAKGNEDLKESLAMLMEAVPKG